MIKEIIVEIPAKSQRTLTTVCDYCGKGAWTKCTECGADLCPNHRNYHPDDTDGDYTDYICKDCLEIVNSYAAELQELEDKIQSLRDEQRSACIHNRKLINAVP